MKKMDIFEAVTCMSTLIRCEERKKCTELRLQLIHYEVLNYLSHSNQYADTPAATASYFGMTRGTVSQSLIVLEKKGYLEKNKDQHDKRIIHVKLSESGHAILKKARRVELFDKASLILKKKNILTINNSIFTEVLNALQKASDSPAFKAEESKKLDGIKQPTVFDLIEHMAALIRSEERKRCTALKLQLVHFQIMEYLSLCNKYSDTPAAIANYLGMTRGTISQSLMLLEKKEFIEKTQSQSDKRVYHIRLQEKGLNILKKAMPVDIFKKAAEILEKHQSISDGQIIFVEALTALQKANDSYSFGVCSSCQNFLTTPAGFLCNLTKEQLSQKDSEKICQEHVAI